MLVYDWEEVSKFYHFYDICVNVNVATEYTVGVRIGYILKLAVIKDYESAFDALEMFI